MSNKKVSSLNKQNPLKRKREAILPLKRTYIKQTNTLTWANYDFSQIQIKGLVIVLEKMQEAIEEAIKTKKPTLQLSFFDTVFEKEFEEKAVFGKPAFLKENVVQFKIPLKDFGVSPNNYDVLKASLKTMQNTPVELALYDETTKKSYTKITSLFDVVIENPLPYFDEKKNKIITPRVNHVFIHMKQSVALSLLTLEKGFTKFMKEIVMKQSSKYTIRMYMLMSAMSSQGGVTIRYSKLCRLLGIEKGQYKNYSDFHKRVIRPAYEALHEKADIWFEVSETYDTSGKNIERLNFKIIQDRKILEQEEFFIKRENILQLIETHFHLSAFDLNMIKSRFTEGNINNFYSVIYRIQEYIQKNEVVNSADYAYNSIMNEFDARMDFDKIIGNDDE